MPPPRSARHRAGPIALAVGLAACRGAEPPPEPEPVSAPPAGPASAAPGKRRLDRGPAAEEEGLPLAGDDRLWGIAVPLGCVPRRATESLVDFRCSASIADLRRFYQFRFPALQVTAEGWGVTVRDPDAGGAAQIQEAPGSAGPTRLTVFRGRHLADDPLADELLRRLGPIP